MCRSFPGIARGSSAEDSGGLEPVRGRAGKARTDAARRSIRVSGEFRGRGAVAKPADGGLRAWRSALGVQREDQRRLGADENRSGRSTIEVDKRCASNGITTQPGVSPYDLVEFATTKSEIRNPDGSVVFSLAGRRGPVGAWSQVAADVIAQKYFRKAGVPSRLRRVEEESVPSFLWRSVPDETAL